MKGCSNCEHATLETTPCRECYLELCARVAELEKENYDLRHSITKAIDPRRADAPPMPERSGE